MVNVKELQTEELVRLAQEGDGDALEAFLLQMQPMIYHLSLKLLGNPSDAEDMSQDVYVKVLQNLPDLREPAAAPAWVKRIVETSCINSRKKARDYVFEDEDQGALVFDNLVEESIDALPGEYMDMYAKRKIITQMIDELPEKQRLVVYLYYYSELSVQEIAELMEISPGTVKSRLSAARAAIKEKVESEERKGNKLYVFFPFLGRMLREESKNTKLPPLPVAKEAIAAAAAGYGALAAGAAGGAVSAGATETAATAASATVGGAATAAAGKAGVGLGVKLVAGLLAVSLIGGAAVGIPALMGSGKEGPAATAGTTADAQATDGAGAAPTTEATLGPAPESTPEPTPEPTPVTADFDPEALLGQNLSVLIDRFGEPTKRDGDGFCQWFPESRAYNFVVELSNDGETIRGIRIYSGPAILGIRHGDSAEDAVAALEALGEPTGVYSVEGYDGQITYGTYGNGQEDALMYDVTCIDGTVISVAVILNLPL